MIPELCDRFGMTKDRKLEAGEITQRTHDEGKLTRDQLIKLWGKTRLISDLTADDFDALRRGWQSGWDPPHWATRFSASDPYLSTAMTPGC